MKIENLGLGEAKQRCAVVAVDHYWRVDPAHLLDYRLVRLEE
jgi:hypothetical protein